MAGTSLRLRRLLRRCVGRGRRARDTPPSMRQCGARTCPVREGAAKNPRRDPANETANSLQEQHGCKYFGWCGCVDQHGTPTSLSGYVSSAACGITGTQESRCAG
eukprot:363885-Chlamydomonas_euryale.AAC.14